VIPCFIATGGFGRGMVPCRKLRGVGWGVMLASLGGGNRDVLRNYRQCNWQ
jgi:hypothetical protein